MSDISSSENGGTKRIALVAHDSRKRELAEWARHNADTLARHTLVATGTTGRIVEEALPGKSVQRLKSGPLGGDQQLGALIAEGKLDVLFFFVDPMTPLPHDVDVKALTRLAILYNLPMACNRASADFLIASPLFDGHYDRVVPDYSDYVERILERSKSQET